ncbi:hypothetical protein TanjilG_15975 [Lupinus angustifolius]|uniref:ZF-HD dimerization-type domain-containing protein n=1 Tax=Lupinus angustifolius TaxID=3871 RepID=A0A4P1RGT3_LUPAN|nr:PREDICTED: zinc-finger homeodomain protein 2-like [Lupinus angustifolius]OIW10603.1 hypothetical protein TanjilG_15975 [Lupinus angustifolius]
MEFEDQEEPEELCFDPLGNSTRVKISGSVEPIMVPQPLRSSNKARYRECLKNHAVSLGGNALDGCGEFMPAGIEGTLDALKCAACNCHRNFHRKETDTTAIVTGADPFFLTHHHQHHQPPPAHFAAYYRSPAGYLHMGGGLHHRGAAPGGTLALPSTSGADGGCGTQSTREDQEDMSNPMSGGDGSGGSKKRHRTKFSLEQKDKMLEFAERLGWKIQKHDESLIQEFCNENGIKRHVLKVWMHNNKHTLGKKP